MANSTADSSFATYGLENELSGYRSVNSGAVFSLIFGLLSALMFVDLNFFFIPLLGLILGVLALRKIRRYVGVYSGLKMAQAGIGLSVIFSITSIASVYAYHFINNRDANAYAQSLVEVLNAGSPEQFVYLRVPPSQRGDYTPEKLVAERIAGGQEGKMAMESELKPLQDLVELRKRSNQKFVLEGIENSGFDRLTPYAFARFSINAPMEVLHEHEEGDDHAHPAPSTEPTFAMIELKAEFDKGEKKWHINEVIFPYKKNTAKLKEAPADDGHGHGH